MSSTNKQDDPQTVLDDADGTDEQVIESRLQEVCDRITETSYDDLTAFGMYSIHEGSPRMITLPTAADGFDDVTAVKQFCYETNDQELLIIAPVTV